MELIHMLFYEVITGTELEKTLIQKEQFKNQFNKLSNDFYADYGVRPIIANPEILIVNTEQILELEQEIQDQFNCESLISGAKSDSELFIQWQNHCSHAISNLEGTDDSTYDEIKLFSIAIKKLEQTFYIISYDGEELFFPELKIIETLDENILSALHTAVMNSSVHTDSEPTMFDKNTRTIHF